MHRDTAIGKGLPEKVVESLFKADKIGDEVYFSFMNKWLS